MRILLLACLWLAASLMARAQNAALQTPDQFLGYPLGSRFTTHEHVLNYVKHAVTQAPKRCRMITYGTTYEGRSLVTLVIASEANLARLEEIRTNHLKRIGLAEGTPTGNETPLIAWMSYNVHGNESVSSEAVMPVMYDLLNPQNQQTQAWLQNTVVILDPCVNPDGRERYVQWYQQTAAQPFNASPHAWEHHEPWPGGRPNHYLFDLNRDWAWLSQKESQERIALYNQWMPHLHADFHEMGVESPYYFSPAAKPYHEAITPWQRQFQQFIGDANRKYFDANNWLYFTRESYDLLYPSYGDTYPTYNGAIGMTYEQGGSGRAGRAIARNQNDTLTLRQRIDHHYAASLATLEALTSRREPVVTEFRTYFEKARTNPVGTYKTYVFRTRNAEGNGRALTQFFTKHGIQYAYASKNASANGFNYATGKTERVSWDENDLVVTAYQPKSTLLRVLCDPKPTLEDSVTYDITSWALPYAYGMDAYALTDRVAGNTQPKAVQSATENQPEKPYAYLAAWKSLADVQFLGALLKSKIGVRVTDRAFTMDDQSFAPGTLIITRADNAKSGERFDQAVTAYADSLDVRLTPVRTGFVSSGVDFGSSNVRFIKAPRVALLTGEPVSPYGFGEAWHFFEQQIGYPVTPVRADYLTDVPLADFDVLILPNGSYGDIYSERFLRSLKEWVRNGGRVIAMERAAAQLADKPDFLLKEKIAEKKEPPKAQSAQTPYDTLKTYGQRDRDYATEDVTGSVYKVSLDATHPLAFGYGSTYYALLKNTLSYQFLNDGWNVGILKKDGYVSGFAGAKAKEKLKDTPVLAVQDMGDGAIVYMLDNPLFRGFWHGGKLLFGNAVFLVGQE